VGLLGFGSGPHVVGWLGSMQVSASFQIIPCPMGQLVLGSGPHFVGCLGLGPRFVGWLGSRVWLLVYSDTLGYMTHLHSHVESTIFQLQSEIRHV